MYNHFRLVIIAGTNKFHVINVSNFTQYPVICHNGCLVRNTNTASVRTNLHTRHRFSVFQANLHPMFNVQVFMDIWYPCFNKMWEVTPPSIHDMLWPSSVEINFFPNWWIWFQVDLPYLLQAKFQQKKAIHEILMLPLCWSQEKPISNMLFFGTTPKAGCKNTNQTLLF